MSTTGRSYTQIFLKVQRTIIQAILSRKLMEKITVTDEKYFVPIRLLIVKITVIWIGGLPTHSFQKKAVSKKRKTMKIKFCHKKSTLPVKK